MGSMLELEESVEEIKRELEIQNYVNQLTFTLIIQSINQLSPKQNVREVMMAVMKEVTPVHLSSAPVVEEAFKRVEKIISKT
ncbi:hypothetical protein AAAW43_003744 [Cronobacter sakazakii]|uniref:hypothetical protein n=1 Tax=Cronobacter sakazakii TaxID=28141 RepID=UPI000A19336D|nr:hypothetical protein [Cronobacter sakazakii]ELY2955830.1 hypothetical protein [Cronobacter sakazakii]ELZ3146590.1 hypothetical protein [Cronobacter sakazakii]EMA5529844.1 hypothetical protein [Cronobacter sakazakii]EMC4332178.1 hypothetical protein [Cronobacter sakazakii]EMD7613611.1 hypothetical protein [Cronobacter sakazakii]